jgi:uncharacterized protein YjbI with pentapeptide repeats
VTTPIPKPIDPRYDSLQSGELLFPAPAADRKETPAEIDFRTIPAEWLESFAPRPARPIVIANAIIEGDLHLDNTCFEYKLSITDSEFRGDVDFSFAVFKHTATFKNTTFSKRANFRAAHAAGDLDISGAHFKGESMFQDLHVEEVLRASRSEGANPERDATFANVNFGRIDVGKEVSSCHATFLGETRFNSAHIRSDADFDSAQFNGIVYFDGLQVDGTIAFRRKATKNENGKVISYDRPVTFGGKAVFIAAHIGKNAEFLAARFKEAANFDGMEVGGVFHCENSEGENEVPEVVFEKSVCFPAAVFKSSALFTAARFKGEAHFESARFQGEARFTKVDFKREAHFENVQFQGKAEFRQADFKGEADSKNTQQSQAESTEADLKGEAHFEDAQFQGAARFDSSEFGRASFRGTRFECGSHFIGAKFRCKADSNKPQREADFAAAVDKRDIQFQDAEFAGRVCFRDASFQVVHFGKPKPQAQRRRFGVRFRNAFFRLSHFGKPALGDENKFLEKQTQFTIDHSVEFCGLTYNRIYVDLDKLFQKIETTDRQPYTQLEQTLRAIGDDEGAERVYLERRRVERLRMFDDGRRGRWLVDWIYSWLCGYGIRPSWLLPWTIVLLFIGTLFFYPKEALRPKDAEKSGNAAVCNSGRDYARALEVSVHQFLPIDVPIGSDCVPARLAASWYATVLRLAGAVLVGIGLGSVTGLLRRASP